VPAGFNTHDAVVALENEVFNAQFFGVKVDCFQHVDDGRQHLLGQRESRIVFGVAADLQHPFAHVRKGRRQVGTGGAFANATFAVDGKHLGVADLQIRVELHLQTALAIKPAFGCGTAPDGAG
jgi:hypothetical protein